MKPCRSGRAIVRIAVFFLFATLLAVLYTYPVITDIHGKFYGFPWDSLGSISSFWWFKFSFLNEIPFRSHAFSSFPEGVDFSNAPFFYIYYLSGLGLSLLSDEVAAYNMIKILSFPMLALTSYVLLDYLSRDTVASMWCALAFAFSPFHAVHLMSHQPNLFWLPLLLYLLLRMLDEGGWKVHGLFGLVLGLALVDSTYFMYFGAVLSPVLILGNIKRGAPRKTSLKATAVNGIILAAAFAVAVIPMVYPVIGSSGKGQLQMESLNVTRSLSDLFVFSAKPLDYLLPSRHNLFLGWLVPDLGIGPLKGHRYIEHTLYLGWTLIALGVYAVYAVSGRKGKLAGLGEEKRKVYTFFALAVAAAILSGPPFIPIGAFSIDTVTREISADYKVYLPQYYLFNLLPFFRSYARLGAVVSLAVCVLAAFGLKALLSQIRQTRAKAALLALLTLVLAIEFIEYPPFRVTDVTVPGHYRFLAGREGDFPVVEYPIGSSHDPYTTYEYLFYQRVHKKRLVNGAYGGDALLERLSDISAPQTIDALAGKGVKYILLHRYKYERGNEYVPMDWLTTPGRDKLFPAGYSEGRAPDLARVRERLREVKDFGGTVIYEIKG